MAKNKKKKKPSHSSGKKETFEQVWESPCLYCDSKPVYLGTAVFLKDDRDIMYDPKLRRLISTGHRFVLAYTSTSKINTVLICLLSTSSFMNQELEKGIKLSGIYHDKKAVYVDVENSWVIPVDCVKSVDYRLEETDALMCVIKFMSSYIKDTTIFKGILNSEIVDKQFESYTRLNDMKKLATMNPDVEPAKALDISFIKDYVWGLPEALVDDYLSNNVTAEEAEILVPRLQENEQDESNLTPEYIKRVLMAYHIYSDDIQKYNVVRYSQRGY